MKFLFLSVLIAHPALAFWSSAAEDGKWPKDSITVCWSNTSFPDEVFTNSQIGELRTAGVLKHQVSLDEEIKSDLKKLISTEFSKKRTGINFNGWENCSSVKTWDVAIVATEQPIPLSFVGMAPIGVQAKSFVYLSVNQNGKMTYKENLLSTALHEFGHVAGLKHEHDREEAQIDPLCHEYMKNPEPSKQTSSQYYSKYDPSSIMNYCFRFMAKLNGLKFTGTREFDGLDDSTVVTRVRNKISIRIGLSKGDVHALKCLYKIRFDSPEFYRKCHSSYDLSN